MFVPQSAVGSERRYSADRVAVATAPVRRTMKRAQLPERGQARNQGQESVVAIPVCKRDI
jgi:hypothetical protein